MLSLPANQGHTRESRAHEAGRDFVKEEDLLAAEQHLNCGQALTLTPRDATQHLVAHHRVLTPCEAQEGHDGVYTTRAVKHVFRELDELRVGHVLHGCARFEGFDGDGGSSGGVGGRVRGECGPGAEGTVCGRVGVLEGWKQSADQSA